MVGIDCLFVWTTIIFLIFISYIYYQQCLETNDENNNRKHIWMLTGWTGSNAIRTKNDRLLNETTSIKRKISKIIMLVKQAEKAHVSKTKQFLFFFGHAQEIAIFHTQTILVTYDKTRLWSVIQKHTCK